MTSLLPPEQTLEQAIADLELQLSQADGACSPLDGFLQVAQKINDSGAIRLQEALQLYGQAVGTVPANSSDFGRRLVKHLPVELFSASRREGWMIAERTNDTFSIIRRLLRSRDTLSPSATLEPSTLTPADYVQLEKLMNHEEKRFCRFLLVKLFGVRRARTLFGIWNGSKVLGQVDEALGNYEEQMAQVEMSVTPVTVRKRARGTLSATAAGGRVPWEKREGGWAAKVVIEAAEKVE